MTLRKHWTVALAALVALGLSGCLKVKSQNKLETSGKGTYSLKATVDLSVIKRMEAMLGEFGDLTEGPDAPEADEGANEVKADFEKDLLKLKHAEGVRVVKHSVEEQDDGNKLVCVMELEYDSLKQLFLAGVLGDIAVKLEAAGENTWTLTQNLKMDGMPEGDLDAGAGQGEQPPMMNLLSAFMKDLEIALAFTAPGEVTKTNGKKSADGRSVTFGGGLKWMTDPKNRTMSVTFKAPGAALKPFALTAAEIAVNEKKLEEKVEAELKAEKEPAGAGAAGG